MSKPHSSFQDVGIFKKKKEGFNSRLPIPSLFRKSHTKQSPSLQIPTPSYPLESSPNNHSRGQSLDLRRPQPTSSPRKSFDLLDLRPRRFALSKQPISNNTQLESQLPLQSTPSSSSKPPRKSLGDSPTSPTVLLVERRNVKVRNPLPTFPESISEEIDDSFKRNQSIGSFRSQDLDSSSSSSSTSNSTTPTNQSDMAIFPSFGSNTNQSSSDLGGSLTVERLNRQRSTSQSSLTRKFSDEAKRLLGGNRDKSRERNLTLDGGMSSGLDGKALKRSSKTKDFDLRSHFMNSNQPISSPPEESTLKDYEQFSTSSNATTMKFNSKSPSKTSSRSSCQRPGSSDSNLSKSSIASSTHSNDSSSPIKKSGFRNRTTSSPTKLNSSTTPPPRSSSRSSSRQTSYGIGMTTSPIRTESGHGEESISPWKANTSFESSLLISSNNSSPSKNGDGVSRPLLGSWLCEEEEDGEDASLQIILSNHRRSSSECSLDVLDRRNLALSYHLQYENRIDEDSQEEEEKKRLENNTFIFPLPPKTLKERHSHSSLRTSNKVQNFRRNHSGGSGPVPIFGQTSDPFVRKPIPTPTSTSKPLPEIKDDDKLKVESVFSNSNPPLRERRSKPPLTLSLKSSTFAENESRNRKVSDSSSSSVWSPPPCPPPSTPLPELPSSSNSIKNKSSFQFDRHSRSSSGNTPSSSPASNGILKYNTRPRSRTFSSSNGVSRPTLFDLNRPSTSTSSAPSSETVNPIDLPQKEKKRVSFGLYDYSIMPSTSTSISSTTSSRPSSILSPSRDSSSSSDWSSPITPGFSSTSSSPAFQFKSLELVSRLNGYGQKMEDEIGNGDEEIEILKDDGLQLHCALGLEGIIGNNLNQFFEDQDLNHHRQEMESTTHQDDEIVYGFAM